MHVRLDGEGPLYRQLYSFLRDQILSGAIRPGARLPSTRTLAAEAKVSRNVVLQAYDLLLSQGYADSRRGSGTYAAEELPDAPSPNDAKSSANQVPETVAAESLSELGRRMLESAGDRDPRWRAAERRLKYHFEYGRPVYGHFPYISWERTLKRRVSNATWRDLDYGPPEGRMELRKALSEYLRRARGVDAEPERIIITSGSQQALDLAGRILLNPGDRVVMEDPQYPAARISARAWGAQIIPVPVDDHGIRTDLLPAGDPTPKLAILTPSHQFPTGGILPLARRVEALDWARRTGAYIFEDDYDSEYRYDGRPVESLQALDRDDRVIYAGTLSKLMYPALRLGYVVLPPGLLRAMSLAKAVADTGSPSLNQLALADFIESGHFERHLRRTKKMYASRRAATVEAINHNFGDRAEVQGEDAGLHVLLWLKGTKPEAAAEIRRKAADLGVGVASVAPFYLSMPPRAGLLLGYAPLREAEIAEGIRLLAQCVE